MDDFERELTALVADYYGVGANKDAGTKALVVKLVEDMADLKRQLRHYLDVEREKTCLGLAEFSKRDEFKKEIDAEVAMVKTAEIGSQDKRMEIRWQSVVQLIGTAALLVLGIAQLVVGK